MRYKDIGVWYWAISIVLLAAGLAGWIRAFHLLILLSAIQVVHFSIVEKNIKAFAVQVRAAYLIIVLVCLWEPLRWLYWWPLIGTTARVAFDYCFLARLVSLLPWNRQEPLTLELFKKRIFSPPVNGSILQQEN